MSMCPEKKSSVNKHGQRNKDTKGQLLSRLVLGWLPLSDLAPVISWGPCGCIFIYRLLKHRFVSWSCVGQWSRHSQRLCPAVTCWIPESDLNVPLMKDTCYFLLFSLFCLQHKERLSHSYGLSGWNTCLLCFCFILFYFPITLSSNT